MEAFVLRKMKTTWEAGQVSYTLARAGDELSLNKLIGKQLKLSHTGRILCLQCGRKTNKSYQQGYCFPCSQILPQADICNVRPERCHHHKGTCRDPAWGQAHCMIPHTIYLANSSGVKVGITRQHQQMTRWMDQGAVAAVPIASVGSRLEAGHIEQILKDIFPDRTNWRLMLKGEILELDLEAARDEALGFLPATFRFEESKTPPISFSYPVRSYPLQIKSFNFDKQADIRGTLEGIKGQYLIFDQGVINIRTYAAYEVTLDILS